MLLIGLTGSIGMGKSTVAARLRALGVAVCDADAEVHKLYEGAAVAPIEAAFPGTTAGGKVDRQKLAQALLAGRTQFKRLEAIVHPLVFEAERDVPSQRSRPRARRWLCSKSRCCWKPAASVVSMSSIVVSAPADAQRHASCSGPA